MRKQLRLRRRKDFDTVFQEGHVLANRLLVLRTAPNQLPHNRYGFVTGKRLGKAVVRNRVRRRLQAAHALPEAAPGAGAHYGLGQAPAGGAALTGGPGRGREAS